jgi:hypothetical protein
MDITLELTGGKKLNSYVKSVLSFLGDLPDSRRNRFVERLQAIDNLAEVNSGSAIGAGSNVLRIQPSKELLEFTSAIGAGHLNRRWNNASH